MANIKNFGLVGVGSEVQFGKAGTKLVSNTGVFKARDAADAAFVRVQIADPSVADDSATKRYVDGVKDSLQGELDNTQLGAGLETDGAYAASSAAAYIKTATSLFNADTLLDTALKGVADRVAAVEGLVGDSSTATMQAEIDAVEAAVGLNPDGTLTAPTGTSYLGSIASVTGGLVALDGQVKSVTDGLAAEVSRAAAAESAIVAGAGLETDGQYAADADAHYIAAAVSLKGADEALDTALYGVDGRLTTAEGKLSTLETTVADQGTRLAGVEADYIKKDGSVAFTGDIDAGSHKLVNLAAPAADSDAATKLYVDDQVAKLGNAFNYVSTVEGGADSAAALDLNALSQKDAGDYYKVAASGYFKAGSDVFFANANDGLVKNVTADGWDKIDNTDSTVAGTANRVAVTGSVDTGFVLDIASTYAGQDSIVTLGTVTTGVWNGTAIATANGGTGLTAIGTGKQVLRANAGATGLEYADLVAGDVAFANGGFTATNVHDALIEAKNAASSASTTLQSEVDAVEAAVGLNPDGTLTAPTGTTALGGITSVVGGLVALDGQAKAIADNLAAETDSRTAADTAIKTGAGLNTDGSYHADTSAGYIAAATSLADADSKLDAAIKALSGTVDTLDHSRIHDDAATTFVDVDSVAGKVEVQASGKRVSLSSSGAAADSYFGFDNATAGEVTLAARSETAADVNLHLIPQGNGSVVIGETGAGVIVAEDGQNLTLGAGAGASLFLQGDAVTVETTAGHALFTATGTGTTLGLTASADAVALAASGAANVDIHLTPAGTGALNVGGHIVTGVSTPVNTSDAANKQYVDASLKTAAVGSVKTAVVALSETAGAVSVGSAVTGTVLRVKVIVTTAFAADSSITIGKAGATSELASVADIDWTTAGIYVIDAAKDYAETQVVATVGAPTGTTGAAKIIVEYLQG